MKKVLLVVCYLLLLVGINVVNVSASEKGKLEIYKSASVLSDNRSAKVTLEVKGNPFDLNEDTNIVLVVDTSTSMNSMLGNNKKINEVKESATELINNLLPSDNIKIGLVYYGQNSNSENNKMLSNDKEQLLNSINNSKISEKNGTNIHSGLKKAYSYFDKVVGNNYIILLTDGEPNLFTGNNGVEDITLGNIYNSNKVKNVCFINNNYYHKSELYKNKLMCESEEGVWGDFSAKDATTQLSSKIKEDNIELFTIGFNTSSNSLDFLKSLATSEKHFFKSNSEEELKDNFKVISNQITIIASEILVEDIIPDTFKLVEEKIDNVTKEILLDGSTKLIWNIGEFNIKNNYKLEYTISALEPFYGSMYTNVLATLKGKSQNGNPFYKSTEDVIDLVFEKPFVPIVAITKDDNYLGKEIYKGDKIEISAEEGLLSNDYNSVKSDNAIVEDEIVVVDSSLNHGNIKVNGDGSFTFRAPDNYFGDISFKYYIRTKIIYENNTIYLNSNESTVRLNVRAKSKVVISYMDTNNNKLEDDKNIYGIVGEEFNSEYIEFDNYNLIDIIGDNEFVFGEDTKYIKYIYEIEKTVNEDTTQVDKTDNDKVALEVSTPNIKTGIERSYIEEIIFGVSALIFSILIYVKKKYYN